MYHQQINKTKDALKNLQCNSHKIRIKVGPAQSPVEHHTKFFHCWRKKNHLKWFVSYRLGKIINNTSDAIKKIKFLKKHIVINSINSIRSIKSPQVNLPLFMLLWIVLTICRIARWVLWPPLKPYWELINILCLMINGREWKRLKSSNNCFDVNIYFHFFCLLEFSLRWWSAFDQDIVKSAILAYKL